MAEQGDVLQILAVEHGRHIVDVHAEVDFLMGEVGALAQPGVGRREEFVPCGAKQRPHLLPGPSGRPRAMRQNDRCHVSPLEAGEAGLSMLLRINRNDSQTNHSIG